MLLCLASMSASTAAFAAGEGTQQKLIYEVYASGFHVVQARLDIDLSSPKTYDISLDADTRGFLGKLVPWSGTFESNGWVMKDGSYHPKQHASSAIWKKEKDSKDYQYNKDGTFKGLTITEHDKEPEVKEVDAELTDNTIDILTATLNVLSAYPLTNVCEGEAEIFDGKRRFKQTFTHEANEQLQASKYNIFEGEAARCVVEVTPVAGDWGSKPRGWMSIQEQGRDRGSMPTVWIGKVSEKGPAVPIKIRVKTAYGTLFMHLAEFQTADQLLVADKRKKD